MGISSWDEEGNLLVPRPTGPQRPLTADDLSWLQAQTNGAKGPGGNQPDGSWNDAGLTDLASQFIVVPEPDFVGSAWPPPADPAGYDPDLWATAALILDYRLTAWLEDPRQSAVSVRDGDAYTSYKSSAAATMLLRSIIKRYWRRADPYNREQVHPSGWRTVEVEAGQRYRLLARPLSGVLIVNGP